MHFVIVSYTFPPSTEIGGRRWAKFSKQLLMKGHEVTVICSENGGDKDFFEKEFEGIKVHQLPKKYPRWLTGQTKNLFEKILYSLAIRVVNPLLRINLFDKAFAWKSIMTRELEAIHSKKLIEVIAATGAPYSILRHTSSFKASHREISLVSDFRDPWTWGDYYGIPTMASRKKGYQLESERFVMDNSDLICYPTVHMGSVLESLYPEHLSKLTLLPHAFDPEKFPQFQSNEIKRKGFIYGGTLYNGIEDYLRALSVVVQQNPSEEFKWDVYTGRAYPLIDELFEKEKVEVHSYIPEEELFGKISQAEAYLVFLPPQEKDLISTKFFEIIFTKTPIIYIGPEGEVGKFIRENKLGVHILPEAIEQAMPKFLKESIKFLPWSFDVTKFTFSSVTDDFIKKIKALRAQS